MRSVRAASPLAVRSTPPRATSGRQGHRRLVWMAGKPMPARPSSTSRTSSSLCAFFRPDATAAGDSRAHLAEEVASLVTSEYHELAATTREGTS